MNRTILAGKKQKTMESLSHYLKEIGRYSLLTRQRERELSEMIYAGREASETLDFGVSDVSEKRRLKRQIRVAADAKEEFINANLRLVVSLAKKYPLPVSLELLDLIQEGNLGLEHAVEKFDGRKGWKFSTYAAFWIRQSIGRLIDQKANIIRIPAEKSSRLRRELRQASGPQFQLSPDMAELHILTQTNSLDQSLNDDGDLTLESSLASPDPGPESVVEHLHTQRQLSDLLGRLPDRTRFLVKYRYGLVDGIEHSYREAGEAVGLTSEAARRIVTRAMGDMQIKASAL